MSPGARMVAWSQPTAYLRRVAYLESHGNELINYDFMPSSYTVITCELSVLANNASQTRFIGNGATRAGGCPEFYRNGSGLFSMSFASDWTSTLISVDLNVGKRLKAVFDIRNLQARLFIEGELVFSHTYAPSWTSSGLLIFGSYNRAKMRVYNLTVEDALRGGIRSYPVLDLNGRPAMYDEVSGRMYYNQGTGEFTWGEL